MTRKINWRESHDCGGGKKAHHRRAEGAGLVRVESSIVQSITRENDADRKFSQNEGHGK